MSIDWSNMIQNHIYEILSSTIFAIIAILKRKKISLLFKRIMFKIQPRRYQIVFALEFKEGLNSGNYYNQINKNFLKQIDNSGLAKQINVLDISDIYLFKKTDDAEKFRREHDLDLIIWGDFSNDDLKIEKNIVNKIDLNFTFRIPQNFKQFKSVFTTDLESKFAQKSYWKIYENNSFNDIQIISNNLFDIATYILAMSLKIFGKLHESTELFANLFNDLKRRNDALYKKVIPHLLNSYEILSLEYGSHRKDLKKGIQYCNKMLQLDSTNFVATCNIALYTYLQGNKEAARTNIDKLKKLNPNSDHTILDVAFFRILDKDFSSALRGYKKLRKNYREVSFNIIEVVEFLEEQYNDLKEPALLFASGFINCVYGDMETGKNDLNQFLIKANQNTHFELIRETKRLLSIDFK